MHRIFARVAKTFPDVIAIGDDQRTITYSKLARTVDALHRRLLTAGTVVMVALPSGVAFTAVQLACFAAGAVFVPIPHGSTQREARSFLDILDPDIVVVSGLADQAPVVAACPASTLVVTLDAVVPPGGSHRVVAWDRILAGEEAVVPPHVSRFPPETRTVQFTSGSSGKPKAILLGNESWLATIKQNEIHLSAFAGEHVFCPLPQFHAMGNAVVLEHLLHGSPVHLANDFDPAGHVDRLRQHRCTAILASPNYFKLMTRLGAMSASALPHLRSFTIGTAAIDEALIRDLRAVLPSADIYCRYGLSESVGAMARLKLKGGVQLPQKGLIGAPVPGVELHPDLPLVGAAEPGELRVKSGANAIGFIDPDGAIAPLLDAEGYLATGDLVYLTLDGHLLVRGRLSSFLKSNGYRINPFEIEELLRGVQRVQEAVVVGVPDAMVGQRIVACIEPSPGQEPPASADLLAACEAELSAHKLPQGFLILSPLPRTPAGKPDRTAILAAATEWQASLGTANAAAMKAAGGGVPERVMAIVIREISQNIGHAVTLRPDENLDRYLDSMAMVSLVVALQDELETTIPGHSLTKENFSSVNAIVALLQNDQGQVFAPAADPTQSKPARSPTANLIVAAGLAVALLAVLTHAPSDEKGPLSTRQWMVAKASCDHCADLVLAGSSQTSVNMSPAAMMQALPGRRIINEGFSTQPYNEGYLDMLEAALTDSPTRSILLLITPVTLVMRSGDDDAEVAREMRANDSPLRERLEEVRGIFHARAPCELLFGVCDVHNYDWLYPDGWSAAVYAGRAATAGVHTSSLFMRRWAQQLEIGPRGYQHVLDRVRTWRRSGIAVYTIRAPVPPEMLDAELSIPGYDEAQMIQGFADAGATWIEIDPTRYVTFDGWHMDRDVAVVFSQDVARAIASLEQQRKGH